MIKSVAKLVASKSARRQSGEFVVEGARLCEELIKSGMNIQHLFYTQSAYEKYTAIIEQLQQTTQQIHQISDAVSLKLSDTKTPQGIYCVCPMLDKRLAIDTIKSTGHYVLLDGLQDPGNIGTVLRSADAFRIDGVIMSEDCPDLYSPKMLRSTMGAFFRVPVTMVSDIKQAIETLVQKNYRVYAAVLDEKAVGLSQTILPERCAVVIGNEGKGLSMQTIECCTDRIFIEMCGNAESLNAAVAASLLMWEMQK